MSRAVVLDAGPLGMLVHPSAVGPVRDWFARLLEHEEPVVVPEIADYEVRRELLRRSATRALTRLDHLKRRLWFRPITTRIMLEAARFWAQARKRGQPTADPHALDADAILAAQAEDLRAEGFEPVVATTNVGHLAQFTTVRKWDELA